MSFVSGWHYGHSDSSRFSGLPKTKVQTPTISVVTPTLHRPEEIAELLPNLCQQSYLPTEVIIVDGAPSEDIRTECLIQSLAHTLPFPVRYIRHGGGTAIQRNIGIDHAKSDYIAFVDDDIRLSENFFEQMLVAFAADSEESVGGITGYIDNQYLNPANSPRWRWYKRLKLFTTFEPGRYDYNTGSPINRYLQPPHDTWREIDFMGAGCAVWRSEVFQHGLRFSTFFTGYGVLEDAHLALRAGKDWKLLENGKAHCLHLHSQTARKNARVVLRIAAINHRFVFVDIVPHRTWKQEFRFWRLQLFDLMRLVVYASRSMKRDSWMAALGKFEGIIAATRVKAKTHKEGHQ